MSEDTELIGEFHYEGHIGDIRYSEPENMFYGVIRNIDDLVLYEGGTLDQLHEQFRHAVLDHTNDLPRGDSEIISATLNVINNMCAEKSST